ncbi:MAG: hypothetical protein K2M36_00480, partial [Clostridia bacterium]|nr:hypothetical protein [Clostridia bacterium]
VIMVTHNGELAKEYATRICRFKDGQLIEDTNPYDEHIEQIAIEEVEEQSDGAAAESGNALESDAISSEEKAAELLTTDTVSLAGEQEAEHNAEHISDGHTLEPAQEVNYEEHSLPEDVHEDKKVSNRKRKKQMKSLRVDSSAVFEKLGLNSLSKQKKKAEKKNKTFKPTSMSAGMAFGLSIRNLISKKRRTFLTAFAGSIGIIGLGLVLSISNGFNLFVENMQRESLASVPLCVYEYNVSPSAFMDMMSAMMDSDVIKPEKPPIGDDITVSTDDGGLGALGVPDMFIPMLNGLIKSFFENVTRNDLSEGFDEYMKGIPDEYAEAVTHYYGVRYNLIGTSLNADGSITYKDVSQQPDPSSVMTISMSILGGSGVQPEYWQMLVGGEETMLKAYDLVGENSRYPQNKNEIVLCVGSDNKIDKKLLDTFGITMNAVNENGEIETLETLNSDFFIGKTLKLVHNDNYFEYIPQRGIYLEADNSPEVLEGLYNDPSSVELKIVGVIRQKEEITGGYVTSSLCYTPELSEYVLEQAFNSEVAKAQRALMEKNPNTSATVFGNESVYGSVQVDDDFTNDASIISVMNNKL